MSNAQPAIPDIEYWRAEAEQRIAASLSTNDHISPAERERVKKAAHDAHLEHRDTDLQALLRKHCPGDPHADKLPSA